MAKAVDNDAVSRLITHWKKEAEDYEKALDVLERDANKTKERAAKAIEAFKESDYISYKVTPAVLKKATKGDLLKAQGELHLASYKLQELSTKFKTEFNVKGIEFLNDANNLTNEIYTEFATDRSVNMLLGTSAAIERQYNAVAVAIIEKYNNIKTAKNIIDEYSRFVEEQMFALSRLDGVLKYHNSLSTAEVMNRANRGLV